jgi:hypothetical protein
MTLGHLTRGRNSLEIFIENWEMMGGHHLMNDTLVRIAEMIMPTRHRGAFIDTCNRRK